MFYADSHTHSVYSFDGRASVFDMCASAVEAGVSVLAVTDHYDIDGILDGLYPGYDADAARREIEAAAEQYAGRLTLVRGIELGQPTLRPEESRAFLARQGFEFVIGSCHNLPAVPDFYFMNFREMPDALVKSLFCRFLSQLQDTARFEGVHTVAHPLYPTRYMAQGGRGVNLAEYEEDFRRLFHAAKETGKAVELNLKGIRAGEQKWEEEEYMLRLWYDCGGRRVTCGTDAHRPHEIGTRLAEAYVRIRAIGFDSICVPCRDGLREVPLTDR